MIILKRIFNPLFYLEFYLMKKYYLLFLFFSFYSLNAQFSSLPKQIDELEFIPVRVSFEDSIIDFSSKTSFQEYMKVIGIDSLQYSTVIMFKGKFSNNQIDVYDMGNVDIFNLKKNEYTEYISFQNVTTNSTNDYANGSFFFNNQNKRNSFLITLDRKIGLILNNSQKYRFIYLYFNREQKYWHILYSNYLQISH